MKFPRLSTRRLMILIVMVALVLAGKAGLDRQKRWLLAEADRHLQNARIMHAQGRKAEMIMEASLWSEYLRASEQPWVPLKIEPYQLKK